MLLSTDKTGKLGVFKWLDEKDVGEEPVVVTLKPAYSAEANVTDVFGRPVGDAAVQMSVSTLVKENWVTVGRTDAKGKAKISRLYYDGPYSFRAVRKGYKCPGTGSLPKVGSSGWMNQIEIVMERE